MLSLSGIVKSPQTTVVGILLAILAYVVGHPAEFAPSISVGAQVAAQIIGQFGLPILLLLWHGPKSTPPGEGKPKVENLGP